MQDYSRFYRKPRIYRQQAAKALETAIFAVAALGYAAAALFLGYGVFIVIDALAYRIVTVFLLGIVISNIFAKLAIFYINSRE